jgi:response regulator RpfG family c-di-GMP phosphodiesterase
MSEPVRILFIDDELLILSALRRSLRKEGHELFFTPDPQAAAGIVGKENIDIVVSDYQMPGMTGVDVLSLIARLHRHTTRIMMTGQADRQATIRAINEGCIHRFIEKPWDDAELKRVLLEAARQIQLQRAIAAQNDPAGKVLRDRDGAILVNLPASGAAR